MFAIQIIEIINFLKEGLSVEAIKILCVNNDEKFWAEQKIIRKTITLNTFCPPKKSIPRGFNLKCLILLLGLKNIT